MLSGGWAAVVALGFFLPLRIADECEDAEKDAKYRPSLQPHVAIMSREMGVPSVVSLPGISDQIETGDIVELDGQAGTVRRIRET